MIRAVRTDPRTWHLTRYGCELTERQVEVEHMGAQGKLDGVRYKLGRLRKEGGGANLSKDPTGNAYVPPYHPAALRTWTVVPREPPRANLNYLIQRIHWEREVSAFHPRCSSVEWHRLRSAGRLNAATLLRHDLKGAFDSTTEYYRGQILPFEASEQMRNNRSRHQ
jgi:hypothetical protein